MKTNRKAMTLPRNQSRGHQPAFAPSHSDSGQGARHPPRNSVVAIADTVTQLTYSARKNNAKVSELYSVWNPPTSSPSASGRSTGARLVSPTMETQQMANEGSSVSPNQRCCCPETMPDVDIVPAKMKTPTNERLMATS